MNHGTISIYIAAFGINRHILALQLRVGQGNANLMIFLHLGYRAAGAAGQADGERSARNIILVIFLGFDLQLTFGTLQLRIHNIHMYAQEFFICFVGP